MCLLVMPIRSNGRQIQDFLALDQQDKRSTMKVKTGGMNILLAYPQFYEEESQQQPGEKRALKLIGSVIPDVKYFTHLLLVYQWDETLPDEEAKRLGLCCCLHRMRNL